MSHFTVMVTTTEPPTQEILTSALQPYHEFESTGCDDQYVIEVDATEETFKAVRDEREQMLKIRGKAGKDADEVPDEAEMLAEYLDDTPIVVPGGPIDKAGECKYGWCEHDEDGNLTRHIKRTNPNSKWDWWDLGGRWSNSLGLKIADNAPYLQYADSAQLRHVDWESMRQGAVEARDRIVGEVLEKLHDSHEISRSEVFALWVETASGQADLLKRHEEARTAGEAPPSFLKWKAENAHTFSPAEAKRTNMRLDWLMFSRTGIPVTEPDIEAWIKGAPAFTPFALLHDGTWHERGQMGWFAAVANEKSASGWGREVQALLGGLPEDIWLSVVDCHV